MLIAGSADELHIHMHGIGRPLHTTFENVRHAKLLTYFAQVLGRAFVFLRRGARYNFQGPDL